MFGRSTTRSENASDGAFGDCGGVRHHIVLLPSESRSTGPYTESESYGNTEPDTESYTESDIDSYNDSESDTDTIAVRGERSR